MKLVSGLDGDGYEPDRIYITSLFSYAWEPVHETIRYYRKKYARVPITNGQIQDTLEPFGVRAYLIEPK